ncbi:hypothetical protein Clacol_009977 [Clathrus columnatus]|uniref:Peptidase M20 dimerisation domain-containing protein n=1 Tax=Clathrus columnatus TaxID=1419009 RepID=A0AAV5ASH7_9AGAM|nr:hypothetical protein Clacol_009977 [Clathrus columnatus]
MSASFIVWDRCAFQIKTTFHGHTGSVLALEINKEREWLFSSSSDSTVRIWSTRNLTPVCILTPHLDTSAGDIFSLAYSPTLQTLYFGCQNTSLQWYDLSRCRRAYPAVAQRRTPSVESDASVHHRRPLSLELDQPEHDPAPDGFHGDTGLALDRKKWHRFFDNTPRLGRPVLSPAASFTPQTHSGSSTPSNLGHSPRVLQVPPQNIIHSAHYGYIYCMALLPSPLESAGKHQNNEVNHEEEDVLLITGSGDESIKIWKCTSDGPVFLDKFECNQGGVLSLVARDGTIYAGCQDGCVAVWDLETKSLVRLILAQENSDVLAMSMVNTDLYTSKVQLCQLHSWPLSAFFSCIILSSIVTRLCTLQSVQTQENGHNRIANPDIRSSNEWCLITAGNDNDVKIWEISGSTNNFFAASGYLNADGTYIHDPLVKSLSSFVAIPSVSNSEQHREDCRQAGLWLRRCLSQLGADAKMIATGQGTNPLVLATFKGVSTSDKPKPRPRILFYGHYDVISAPRRSWTTPPFSLTGTNGYLYGRGVSDNKGPILAAAYAASDLLRRRALGCDVVFLIEGEEEAGSGGFEKVVKEYKAGLRPEDSIGAIDALLISNSYWIGEDTPCITYGLRGVVHATIDVSYSGPDLHSGVEGGSMDEPMSDMVKILAELVSKDRKVLIPGFYDHVRSRTSAEDDLFALLSTITHKPAESLSSRWREPTLSIHSVETSGPGNSTVIPAGVRAKVSIRVVPDQTLQFIGDALVKHVVGSFEKLKSSNTLKVSIDRTADWWLGDLESQYFKMLEKAVEDEWGITPLRIREGGSIPSVPFLEKQFGCPGLHLPMGQSSDQAHLANERISLLNLRRGKSVVERFLLAVSSSSSSI